MFSWRNFVPMAYRNPAYSNVLRTRGDGWQLCDG